MVDADLLYDVVATVLKLQGTKKSKYCPTNDANYVQIHAELYKSRSVAIMEVIKYLRLAEKLGYIKGRNGYYQHGRGGSKKWHFIKWPPYPYYELGGYNGE